MAIRLDNTKNYRHRHPEFRVPYHPRGIPEKPVLLRACQTISVNPNLISGKIPVGHAFLKPLEIPHRALAPATDDEDEDLAFGGRFIDVLVFYWGSVRRI